MWTRFPMSDLPLDCWYPDFWKYVKMYPNGGRRGFTSYYKYWPNIHDFSPHIGDTAFVWRSSPGNKLHSFNRQLDQLMKENDQ